MFTASGNNRNRRNASSARSTAALIAVLFVANLFALAGLGVSARAGDFPDALRYAPMTWEKPASGHAADSAQAGTAEAATATRPVVRGDIVPVAPELERNFVEVRTERSAPTTASIARKGDRHSVLLIALMSIALATMAGVSVMMFRSLARDIVENERRRSRF